MTAFWDIAPCCFLEVYRRFEVRTRRRGRFVNTRTSYYEGPGFDPLRRGLDILIEVFRNFSQYFQANAGIGP
jgi:hypothetical protein